MASSNLIIKWSGKEYEIEIKEGMTVFELKQVIEERTNVRHDRQKLLNLKHKGKILNIYFEHF